MNAPKNKRMFRRPYRQYKKVPRKTIVSDQLVSKVEFYNVIGYTAGSSLVTFSSTSSASVGILQMLNTSPSYTTYAPLFSRYKITGVSIRVARVVTENEIASNMSGGLPPIVVSLYPGQTNGTLNGSNALYNDYKLHVDSLVNTPQSRYWAFGKNFINGNDQGLGEWNATDSVNAQVGNFSTYATYASTATALMNTFECRFIIYVVFSDKII